MEQEIKKDNKLEFERPKLYQYRWIILTLYTLSVFVNNIPGEIYVSVSNELIEIYNTSETMVTMASTSYTFKQFNIKKLYDYASNFINSLFLILVIVNYGWATSTKVGVILTILGSLVKLFVNYTGFYMIVIGQILIGAGKPFILNCQATMAQNWFYPESRAIIITVMNVLNLISSVLTFMIPGKFIFTGYEYDESVESIEQGKYLLNKLNMILFYFAIVLLLCLFTLKSNPPTPPSELVKQEEKSKNIKKTLFKIFSNRQFLFCFQAYALFMGLTKSLMIVLAYLFKACGQGKEQVSIAGSLVNISAVASLAVIAGVLKKYSNNRKPITIILMILSISSLVLFYFCLISENRIAIYISIGIVGLFIMPNVPLLMDMSCDSIFPINASFAVGIMYIGSRIFLVLFSQFLAIVVGGSDSNKGRVTLTFSIEVIILLCSVTIFSFTNIKRKTTLIEDDLQNDELNQKISFCDNANLTPILESQQQISQLNVQKGSILELNKKS
ncbi:unnamed protein product [Paramecium sonneborni]|uniref:Major facilitator superfamily (MFS) profile domain-containing protein n=1 Tax=Paramecium sonneborni TaxID=65129 RepID=A0A8S1PIB1_9CILI|nr:unnamed protein product [Paramecium sonneborni]